MTVPQRAAHPSPSRNSVAAARSCLLLMLLFAFASLAFGQGLTPGGPVIFGPRNLGAPIDSTVTFTGPQSGADIQSINVVTEGAIGEDFKLVSQTDCYGALSYPEPCNITVSFDPSEIGIRLGALTLTDGSGVVVNTVYLSGVGVGPQFVFAPAMSVTTATAATLSPANFTAGAEVQDNSGNLFFTDVTNNRILERSSAGIFSQVASLNVTPTSGITIDGEGNLYVSSGASVYIITPGATTATIFPTPGVTLTAPTGLAMDLYGDLYIADSSSNKVYQLLLGGVGNALTLTGPGASLAGPTGLAVDSNSNLYIADTGNNRIVERPLGTTSTSIVPLPTLTHPTGVSVDAAGTFYIANTGASDVIESTVSGTQFVLTTTPQLTLSAPSGVAITANGNLVIADSNLGLIYIERTNPLIDFPTPTVVGELDTPDDPKPLTVQGTGNIASTLNAGTDPSFTGTNPTAFLNANTGTCPTLTGGSPTASDVFSIGEVCNYTLNFQPTVVGPNLANLVLATTAAGGLASTSTARLYGIGLNQLTHFTLVASSVPSTTPTTVDLNGAVQLVLTAIDANGAVATDYTGLITFTTSDSNGVYKGGTSPGLNTTTYTMTAADNGVLTIPVPSGLQLNQYGIFTATAVADPSTVPPGANGTAVSNDIYVVEPSTLTLTSSVNPSLVNQSTTFTLTVATTGPNPPGGTVTFYSNGVAIGTSTLVNGSASVSDSFPTAGTYLITATYTSTTNTQGGTVSLNQVVNNLATVTLTSSVNPSLVNQNTTLTAVVQSATAPTGAVTFKSNGAVLGTGTITGGVATLVVSFPTAGNYILTADYGSGTQAVTSAPLTQVVLNAATITLTSSVNPVLLDNPTILTAVLTSTGPKPTGTLTFFDGSTPIGSGTLVNGTFSISASFVYAGAHTITASYSGDTVTGPATSLGLTQNVGDFTLTVASGGTSAGSTIAGGTATYSLVMTPIFVTALPSAVSIAVTGVPTTATGVLTPSTIATGSSTTPVALSVTAAQILAALHRPPAPAHRSPARYVPVALAFLTLPLAWFRRRKRFGSLLASICLLLVLTAGLTGCISSPTTGYYGQTPSTYNLTVTATSGNLIRSTYLTFTVQ